MFSYRVSDSEKFDEPRGEITAYLPRLVEVGVFSEVRARLESVASCSCGGEEEDPPEKSARKEEDQAMLIYEAPDDATAGALVLAAARHGHLRATKTTPLFTSEESMVMMRRAGATT